MKLWVIILIIIAVAIVFWIINTYNKLIRLKNKVQEAFSTMDVYLKKRWDLVPNLVEVVKGYAKYEESTFKEIAELRSGSYGDMSNADKIDANNKLSAQLSKIVAVAENYPELKANENFVKLQGQLEEFEKDIAESRKYYNAVVLQYNNAVMLFPQNIVASMFHFTTEKMFEAAENERENVKVQF